MEPQNAREWGLFHEESALKGYQRVSSHTHHKLELVSKGFLISKPKPFLGANVDNIQQCQCSDGCRNKVSSLFAFFVYSCNAGRPSNSVTTAIGLHEINKYLSI